MSLLALRFRRASMAAISAARMTCFPLVDAMQPVCEENRVERAVLITKNAAQACDTGGGQGTQRPLSSKKRGAGPPPAFRADDKPSRHFSGVRNPVFGADGLRR
jgi:hypothetical protein